MVTTRIESLTAAEKAEVRRSVGAYEISPEDIMSRVQSVADAIPVMSSPPTVQAGTSVGAGLSKEWALSLSGDGDPIRVINALSRKTSGWSLLFGSVTLTNSSGNAGDNENSNGVWLEFFTDAPEFAVELASLSNAWAEVDGVLVSNTPSTQSDTHPDAAIMTVDFGASAVRKVRIRTGTASVRYGSVFTEPEYAVWPGPVSPVRGQLFGDSMSVGTATVTNQSTQYPSVFFDALGINDYCISSIGGTGFLNDGSEWRYESHLSDVSAFGPDLLIFQASVNDSISDLTAYKAAVSSCLTAARALVPNAIIAVTGVVGGKTADDTTRETATQEAVDDWDDARKLFVPCLLASGGPHLFGTGNISSAAGDGNMDRFNVDGSHLNEAGYVYAAQRLAMEFASALKSSGLRP